MDKESKNLVLTKKLKIYLIIFILVLTGFVVFFVINNSNHFNFLQNDDSDYTVQFKVSNILNDQAIENAKIIIEELVGCGLEIDEVCPNKSWFIYTDAEGKAIFKYGNKSSVFGFTVEKNSYKTYSGSFMPKNEKEILQTITLLPSYAKIQSSEDAWNAAKQDERVIQWLQKNNVSDSGVPAAFDHGKEWLLSKNIFKPCCPDCESLCPGDLIQITIKTESGEVLEVSEISL